MRGAVWPIHMQTYTKIASLERFPPPTLRNRKKIQQQSLFVGSFNVHSGHITLAHAQSKVTQAENTRYIYRICIVLRAIRHIVNVRKYDAIMMRVHKHIFMAMITYYVMCDAMLCGICVRVEGLVHIHR